MYTIASSRKALPAAPGPGILAVMVLAESPSLVTAVLGPTNTGKTHLAIERLLGHESGMIGFPLRLLARENYDRLVAAKGARAVALITGEEKILPADARDFVDRKRVVRERVCEYV